MSTSKPADDVLLKKNDFRAMVETMARKTRDGARASRQG
jgi:hypothetical protein